MKKIFFSYPHDKNKAFVEKIKTALEQKGHAVWFDDSEIKEGDEWRRKITEGLLDTETTVAFLSKHSVRDPGVCLNEIAIAMAEQSEEAMVTVLLEPEKEVQAPLSVTNLHWLNMADWLAREQSQDEDWYQANLDKLLEIIENPSSVNRHSELNTLKQVLNPLSFNAERKQHLNNFVGREWLFEEIKAWSTDEKKSRVFHIQGGPGLGKTAIATQLCHKAELGVVAVHICRYENLKNRDQAIFVKTLAYHLASRLPDYRARLLKVLAIQNPSKMVENGYDIWSDLIAEPMSGIGGQGLIDRQRLAIVIDGLDEATKNDDNPILELIAQRMDELPPWLTFILTSRPNPEIIERLSQYKPIEIKADDPNNLTDLSTYVDQWLSPYVTDKTITKDKQLTKKEKDHAQQVILDKAGGSFLYVTKLREAQQEGLISLKQPTAFPDGLNGIYLRFFERRFAKTGVGSQWMKYAKPLLSYMLHSPAPLPLIIAQRLMGWDQDIESEQLSSVEIQRNTLRGFGSLVQLNPADNTLSFFHLSVREWLQNDKQAGNYFISPRAHQFTALTETTWQHYLEQDQPNQSSAFGWQVLPILLQQLKEKDASALQQLLGQPPTNNINHVLFALAESLTSQLRFAHATNLFLIQIDYAQQLCQQFPENADYAHDLSVSFNRMGGMQLRLENGDSALGYYQQSLEISQDLCKRAPENADYARGLSISFSRLGDIQLRLGDGEAALDYYQQALTISQDLCERAPENADYACTLSVSFNKLGDIQSRLGDVDAALGYYQQSHKIFQDLCERVPESAEYARGFSVSFNQLGDMQLRLGDVDAALGYYQQSHKIFQDLRERVPESAEYARDLSFSFNQLGDIQLHLGGDDAALDYYQQSHNIFQDLCERAPESGDYARGLSISFDRLGDIQLRLGNDKAALGYYQQSHKIFQDLCERAPENAEYARDLSASFNQLGDMQLRLGDGKAALGYYQQSHNIIQDLRERAPESADYARDLSASFDSLGDIQLRLGDDDAALGYYQQSLEIRQDLRERAPENADYASYLSVSFDKLGNIQLRLGDGDAALGYYQQSLEIRQGLRERAPENADYAHDLCVSFDKLGNIKLRLGDGDAALNYYQQSLEISQDLCKRVPENADYASALSVSFNQLGDMLLHLGDAAAALNYYQQSLEISQDLRERAPESADYARALSVSFDRLGDIQLRLGDGDAALDYYQQSHNIFQDLSKRAPESADYARDLCVSFHRLGDIQLRLGDSVAALEYYQQSHNIFQDLSQRAPENADYARDLAISYWRLAQASQEELALDLWKQCYEQFKSMQVHGILASDDVPFLEEAKKQAYGDG